MLCALPLFASKTGVLSIRDEMIHVISPFQIQIHPSGYWFYLRWSLLIPLNNSNSRKYSPNSKIIWPRARFDGRWYGRITSQEIFICLRFPLLCQEIFEKTNRYVFKFWKWERYLLFLCDLPCGPHCLSCKTPDIVQNQKHIITHHATQCDKPHHHSKDGFRPRLFTIALVCQDCGITLTAESD